MKFYSTNGKIEPVSSREATINGLASDSGLFMPASIPSLDRSFIADLPKRSFQEISCVVLEKFFGEDIPSSELDSRVKSAFSFPCPLRQLDDNLSVLELYHGPTLAFKDFGARMMAQLMSYFWRGNNREVTILVATSGDTGSAVAHGFYELPGVRVVLLYPSGKVSNIQEKQFSTLGKNISALEIEGTFDDCQRLVKSAFVDKDLTTRKQLASANSINIARLIPQSCYYFEAFKQCPKDRSVAFSVPSGNFGNLTAGLIAFRMGLPVHKFIAATNANDVVSSAFKSGTLEPRPSVQTISNAMDVGNPSNVSRILALYQNNWDRMREDILACSFGDANTVLEIKRVYSTYRYVIDPHTAVGCLGWDAHKKEASRDFGVVLSTAHPAKFIETTKSALGFEPEIPERLKIYLERPKLTTKLSNSYDEFKSYLLSH